MNGVAPPEAVAQLIASGALPKGVNRYRAAAMLVQVAALVRNGLDAGLSREGLSGSGLQILAMLSQRPEGASCSALAEQLGVKLATVTGLVNTLEKSALVERREEATDGRKWKVVLTAKGRATCARTLPAQARRLHALTEGLTEAQAKDFIAALEVIAANVSSLSTSKE
jgi:MarR family transcriptional regulator, negative regulator of the multidrug operon emrRAB